MNRRDFLRTSAVTSSATLLLKAAQAASDSEPVTTSSLAAPAMRHLPDLAPAEWIWYPSCRCLANTFVLFRRELTLSAPPRRATGWIVADSRYRLEVNGQRIQWGPAPSDPRWPEVDPVDLTATLHAGENILGATVLYFGHGDGTWPIGKPGFLFWLEIEHADGRLEKIVSDATWKTLLCRAWKPGQYKRWFLRALQEEFDARLYPHGWSAAEFQPNADWLPAMLLGGSANQPALLTNFYEYATGVRTGPAESELRPRSIPLLREMHVPAHRLADSFRVQWSRPAEEYFESRTPDAFTIDQTPCAAAATGGEWRVHIDDARTAALTFEFTEQIVGWPHFTIEAPAGTTIELMTQEGHDAAHPALLNTHFDGWTRFICREGTNHFECFDFESLRWLQLHIRNSHGAVTVRVVGVRRRIYPWPNEPLLRTNEPALQRLFDASINTLHNCAQDIIVDGMGRERQQYSGDCGHQLHAIRSVFGETRSPARFLTTYSQGQTIEGYFLDCWPAYDRLARIMERQLDLFHLGPILEHGVQLNFDCWYHYLDTGDLEAVREPYPRLIRFANYLRGLIGRDGLLPVENLGTPCVWMDYSAYHQSGQMPHETQRHKQCAFNLYTAAMFQHVLAQLCRAFGDNAAAESLTALGGKLEAATVKTYWSEEHGLFVNNLPWLAEEKKISVCDRSLATALMFDQCPGGNTAAAIRALADCPPEMGLSYPANAGWRLWALAKAGRADVIVKDLRERWATMDSVQQNNSLQEGWKTRPDTGLQWSHCAVAPLYITHQGLAGIRPLTPGYRRVEIRPQLADLEQLELTTHTVLGPLHFRAQGKPGARELTVELPDNCSGELVLPREENIPLQRLAGPASSRLVRYQLPAGKPTTVKVTAV